MIKHFNVLLICVLSILSLKVFSATFFPLDYTSYWQFFATLVAVGLSVPFVFRKVKGFILPVILILVGISMSIPMSIIFWDQGMTDTIKATLPYFMWFFFFYLLYIRFPIKTLEHVIVALAIIYFSIFVFQYLNSHTVLFGTKGEYIKDRGIIRVSVPGSGLLLLASFISLNKLSSRANGKWFWLGLATIGFFFPFLVATRQMIATIMIIYLYHVIREINFIKKAAILGTLVSLLIFVSTLDIAVIKGIGEANKETFAKGEEDIRVLAGTYFLTEFSPSVANKVLGNGVPYGRKSAYGRFTSSLGKIEKYHISDVGLIGLYVLFGILPLIAYFIIWYKSLSVKVPDKYSYVKYYLWFLLITSMTSSTVFNVNYIMTTVFVLYIYQSVYSFEKYKLLLVRELLKGNAKKLEDAPISEEQIVESYLNQKQKPALT